MNDAEKLRKLAEDMQSAINKGFLNDSWEDAPSDLRAIADRSEREDAGLPGEFPDPEVDDFTICQQYRTPVWPDDKGKEIEVTDGRNTEWLKRIFAGYQPESKFKWLTPYDEGDEIIFSWKQARIKVTPEDGELSNNPGELEATVEDEGKQCVFWNYFKHDGRPGTLDHVDHGDYMYRSGDDWFRHCRVLPEQPKSILDPTLAVGDVAMVGGEPMECVYVKPTDKENLSVESKEVPVFLQDNWWSFEMEGEKWRLDCACRFPGFAGFRDHNGTFQPVPIGVRKGWVVLFEEKGGEA